MLANLLAPFRRTRQKFHTSRERRRLRVDALEERTLLSVTPVDILDKLVNQSLIPNGGTIAGQSLAVDADGDFVVVWTRYDTLTDPNTGLPIVDPLTGQAQTEANIYARYLTDEVQRITLPSAVLNDTVPTQYARFSLIYGGSTLVQKLTISATYQPYVTSQQNIAGTFVLQADANGDGIISPTERATIVYNETADINTLASSIQTALQGIGGPLQNAKVTPVNAKEFVIEYGSAALGINQPKLSVGNVNFASGFYPAVQVSTVREPILIANIPISPNNPQLTAQALEQAFNTRLQAYALGPIDFPPPDRVPSASEGPYTDPLVAAVSVPQISVTAVNATTFDIRFIGDSGKQDHPELIISAVSDELGNSLLPSPQATVTTLKQSSPEFRVNPEEPDDPFTPGPDKYNQINPAVAMDADGEFVIVWESEVPDSVAFASVTDVFARRFRAVGTANLGVSQLVVDMNADGIPETPISGILPLVSPLKTVTQTLTVDAFLPGTLTGQFRLSVAGKQTENITFDSTNLATTAANIQGALVMAGFQDVTVQVISSTDPYKFRVTFTQTFSGPNGLADAILQYVDPTVGVPLSTRANVSSQLATGLDLFTFQVNTETLRAQFAPAVAMDMLGNFVIAWANSAQDFSYYNGIKAQIFDRNGNKVGNEFLVNTEDTAVYLNPAVGMARTGEFVIAWDRTHDVNYLTGGAYVTAVQAKAYNLSGQVILPQFGVGGGGDPAVAFDSANHFLVTWEVIADPDNTGQTTSGVRGIVYDLNGNTIRDVFRANSATFDPADNTLWPLYQGGAQGGLDADGDMFVVYDGYGPDVSQNTYGVIPAVQQLLRSRINASTNADLLNYFDPQNEYLMDAGSPSNGDVDGIIETILIRALNRGANAEQVGRLRAILDSVAGLLRGEANGVMFSRFDASPAMAYTTLFSDSIANTLRDGNNTRYLILMDRNLNWESFIIRLYRNGFAGYEDITINNIQTNQVWNIGLTADRIDALLEGAARTGTNWAETRYEGSIDVRILSPDEVANRIGTLWDLGRARFDRPITNLNDYVIYEVTFQGEGHDSPFYMTGVWPGRAGGNDVAPPPMGCETYGNPGVTQTEASIGVTPEGSFVILYTQYEQNTDGMVTNATIRYRQFRETADTAGPFVTDILAPTGTSLWGGATVEGSVSQIVVTFNEELLGGDPQAILDSVLNPENFVLYRNGVEIPRGIVKVDFGMNAASLLNGTSYDLNGDGVPDGTYQLYSLPTNKWEAVLTVDGNGALEAGTPGLADGDYQLVIRAPSGANSGIRDKAGNALNSTGFVPAGANATLSFHVTVSAQDQPVLDTNARTQPESPNAVARDADGDYVVVWTQTDASGRNRVYFRMYDRDGTPANLDLNANGVIDPWEIDNAPATPVTTSTAFAADDQQNASVAMTPDGDFVITWTNTRSGNADIYARRFAASGQALGEAFLVNSVTGGDQKWSDVAMDAEGNFVVAWSSWGQETGGVANRWGIFARRFDQLGQPMGAEFAVNTVVAGDQVLPSVSMDYRGNFAIAWQTAGGIALRTYDAAGVAQQVAEIALGTTVIGQKAYPDVAMAASGQYLAVSWVGPDGNGNGVYVDLLQWDPVGLAWAPVGASQLVNTTVVGEQGYASIAMAVNGSFVVSWSGIGTQAGQEDQLESGVFYQQFSNTGNKVGGERRVNQVISGKQWAPSVGADADGNFIVVFTGPSAVNPALTTVYRFDSRVYLNQGDVSAPIVTKVLTGAGVLVTEGARVTPGPQELVVVLSEAMSQRLADINGDGLIDSRDGAAPDSVLNLQNWKLYRDGQEVAGAIKSVTFRYNEVARRYEAVLTLDSDPVTSALDALVPGEYQLVVGDVMTDEYPYFRLTDPITGRQLDGDRDGVAGTAGGAMGFVRNFRVVSPPSPPAPDVPVVPVAGDAILRTQPESPNAVARDADGDYVVVWTQTDASGRNRVYFRLFDRDGTPADLDLNGNGVIDASEVNNAPATPVTTSSTFATDDQQYASVAMTPDGDFVITWTNTRSGNADIYARRFAASGQPLGEAFLVNTFTVNDQKWSDVATDAEGNFIVVWSSYNQLDIPGAQNTWDIFGRRFDRFGQPLGVEFLVNVTTTGDQTLPSVAMDIQGGFVVAWQCNPGREGKDVYARSFWPDGSPQAEGVGAGWYYGEFLVNQTLAGDQVSPDVAMSPSGDQFVVTWTGPDSDSSGVYFRQFSRTVDIFAPLRRVYNSNISAPGLRLGHPVISTGPYTVQVPYTVVDSITINDVAQIQDLNVTINIQHRRASDLLIELRHVDTNTEIVLSNRNPQRPAGTYASGANYINTTFDDEAATTIVTGSPPFTGSFVPMPDALSAFDGQSLAGTWELVITDMYYDYNNDPRDWPFVLDGYLISWQLSFATVPPSSAEILVNETTAGPQFAPSIAMAYDGSFVITWTGTGLVPSQEDISGTGVFYRKFDALAAPTTGETRANNTIQGDQRFSSVAMDADGNFIIVFTGPVASAPGLTTVFQFDSRVHLLANELIPFEPDSAAPLVTSVQTNDGRPIYTNAILLQPVTQIVVAFSENLNTDLLDTDGDYVLDTPGLSSILNPKNFELIKDGQSLPFSVIAVDFGWNAVSRKYEARLTLDGDTVMPGVQALGKGVYALRISDAVVDLVNHRLDADRDGTPGDASGQGYYQIDFAVGPLSQTYEHLVNQSVEYVQAFAVSQGPGLAVDRNRKTLAVDAEGNFAVVWMSFGQDDRSDSTGAGVYVRVFDRAGVPITPEILVNQTVVGSQTNPVIAMDADGDFVVVWESQDNVVDGSRGIWARLFNSVGQPLTDEILVNTLTAGDQYSPSVAMDDFGNFAVVWATRAQPFSYYNDIKGQLFSYRGEKIGSEFLVNEQNIAGTTLLPGSNEVHPAVAMDPQGNFVVAWEQVVQQRNGVGLDTVIVGRLFQSNGAPLTGEFAISQGDTGLVDPEHDTDDASGGADIQRRARNPQVIMDRLGNFSVVWEAYQDNDIGQQGADSYGIYFRRFNSDATPADDEHQANLVVTETTQGAVAPGIPSRYFAYNQLNPSIAMDANGQYVVVWDGNGSAPHVLSVTDKLYTDWDRDGVWIRQFQATTAGGDLEFVSPQTRVPYTSYGPQQFPSVVKTLDGDIIVVWSGRGIGDPNGIFFRKYTSIDAAGPIVTDVYAGEGIRLVGSRSGNVRVSQPVNTFTVVFSEDMMRTGPDSVTNPQNYLLIKDGSEIVAIKSVTFGLNPQTNKWEAVLTVDSDSLAPGDQPLPSGNYELRVLSPVLAAGGTPGRSGVRDKVGNALNESGLSQGGQNFTLNFQVVVVGTSPGTPGTGATDFAVNTTQADDQTEPVVAIDSRTGNVIVVWTSRSTEQYPDGSTALATDILCQIYNSFGEPIGPEFVVNNDTIGNQFQPAVAVDGLGRFIVTWAGEGQSDADGGVWARILDSQGNPLGSQFRVNQYRNNAQYSPKVAADSNGNFVVTWSSYGQDGDKDGVYARLYNAFGQARSDEFRVNTTTANYQRVSDVAMDDAGNFVVVWMSYNQDGSGYAAMGRVFNANGSARTGEFRINQYTTNDQIDPRVAMDPSGNFVVTWSSFGQDGSGYGVFARLYSPNGTAKGNEFRVNQTTLHWQYQPDVAMDQNGNFTIVWTTSGQDNDLANDWGIYGRMFKFDGSDRAIPGVGTLGEFRVNAAVAGHQITASIGMDKSGNSVVAWAGPSTNPDPVIAATNGSDIFARWFVLPSQFRTLQLGNDLVIEGTNANDTLEFIAGTTLANSTVKLNGQLITVPNNVTGILFDAQGGRDLVKITGTNQVENLVFAPTQVLFTLANSQVLTILGAEQILADGKGGSDQLTINDSPRVDTFVAKPTSVMGNDELGSYNFDFSNFELVRLISSAGGEDVAMLYDSAANDTFVATPTYAEMSGTGYKLRAERFRYAHGYGSAGGIDTAMMYDSAGDDEYVCTPDYNILRGDNFYIRAKFFDYVHAYATAGGYDKATIKGSAGDDKIVIEPNVARLNAGSYIHRGKFFEEVTVRGGGGRDIAYVYDGVVLPGTVARGVAPVPMDATQIAYLQQIYKIQTYNEGGTGTSRTIRPAVDAVFSAYWP